MAYQLATAFVKIGTSGLSGLGAAFTSVRNIVFGAIGGIGSLIAKFGTLAGGIGLGFAVKLAADAEEMESMFGAVFQGGTADAKEFATTLATDIGRSVGDVMGQMASFQDLFVPLGFAREEGKELSKTMVKLAQDVGSFKNQDPADVASRFSSALVGNNMAVRSLGIVLTEASLEQELLNMGIRGGTKAATQQEKVQARLNQIIRGSGDAIGDAERTAGSFTNRLKGLTGAMKDLGGDIGSAFLPALANIAKSLTDLIRRIQPFVQKWAKFFGDIGKVATTKWALTWEVLSQVMDVALSGLQDGIMQLPTIFGFALGKTSSLIIEWGMGIGDIIADIWNVIFDRIRTSWDQLFANMMAKDFGENGGVPIDMFLGKDLDWDRAMNKRMSKFGKGFGMGSVGGSLGDVMEVSQGTLDKMDALKDTVGEFTVEMDKMNMFADEGTKDKEEPSPEVKVKTLTAGTVKLPSGFIDFASANKTIQEALLKNVDPAKEQVNEQKKGNQIAAQMKAGIDVIGAKLSGGGPSGGPIATS